MYVNTSKRVNTRLFADDPGRFQIPPPGTVIDADTTEKDTYEFYLVFNPFQLAWLLPDDLGHFGFTADF